MSARDVELIADGFHFLEGPRWHDSRLWFSDFHTHRVHVLEPDGELRTVCEVSGRPSGLGFTPAGELLVVSMLDRRLLRLDGDELVEVADLSALVPGQLNDMVVDAAGRAYIGNFGFEVETAAVRPTRLVRVDPDGGATIVGEPLVFPNGAALTPDGRTMLIAESFAFRISALDVAADGSLSGRRDWARFAPAPAADIREVLATDAVVPDGICLDADGALWVADAKGVGVRRVLDGGEVVDFVSTGELAVFAVALGGADRQTLYMCAGPALGRVDPAKVRFGALLACRVDVPGPGLL